MVEVTNKVKPSEETIEEEYDWEFVDDIPWHSAGNFFRIFKGIPKFDMDYWYFHIVYSVAVCCFLASIICGTWKGIYFVDALFNVVSCFTGTGLSTVDISVWNLSSQIVLIVAMLVGSAYLEGVLFIVMHYSYLNRKVAKAIELCQDQEENEKCMKILFKCIFEREASRLLIKIALACFFSLMGSGLIIMGTYLYYYPEGVYGDASRNNSNPYWWALFHSISAMTNAGFSLNIDQLMSFSNDFVILITVAVLISSGNTMAPLMLRIVLSLCLKLSRSHRTRELLAYILDHGHVNYSLVWSATLTKTMVAYVGTLILVSIAVLLGKEWSQPVMAHQIGPAEKILAIWFTVSSTRFAGLNCLDISKLKLSSLLTLMTLMYLPNAAVMDSTLSADHINIFVFFRLHSRKMISRWTPHIMIAYFLIVLSDEESRGLGDMKRLAFEILSAFGTSGYSMGGEVIGTSFSSALSSFGKVVIMYMMMLGRHRDSYSYTNQLRQVELRGGEWPVHVFSPHDGEEMRSSRDREMNSMPSTPSPRSLKNRSQSSSLPVSRRNSITLQPVPTARRRSVVATVQPAQPTPRPRQHFFGGMSLDEIGLPERSLSIPGSRRNSIDAAGVGDYFGQSPQPHRDREICGFTRSLSQPDHHKPSPRIGPISSPIPSPSPVPPPPAPDPHYPTHLDFGRGSFDDDFSKGSPAATVAGGNPAGLMPLLHLPMQALPIEISHAPESNTPTPLSTQTLTLDPHLAVAPRLLPLPPLLPSALPPLLFAAENLPSPIPDDVSAGGGGEVITLPSNTVVISPAQIFRENPRQIGL